MPAGSSTAAIHADGLAQHVFETGADIAPPLSVSTTFSCPNVDTDGHIYSRITNPTRSRAETLLAAMEGTDDSPAHAVLYSSGLAATFAVLSRLLPRRVAILGGYHGTHLVLDQLHRISGGTRCVAVQLPSPCDVISTLTEGDLIWLETPLNPTCELADIAAYTAAAAELKNVHVVVDGTFAPPPIQRPLLLGADVVMHSTTKYLAGHSDAMGGALCVGSEGLADDLRSDRTALGSTPGTLEVWLLLRSLRTLHLRVERQSNTATLLAAWLHQATYDLEHPLAGLVHAVHHPSLPSDPSHDIATRQMNGFGGCFALEVATESAARQLPAALNLFCDGAHTQLSLTMVLRNTLTVVSFHQRPR